ncbi:response regulator [Hufsiella ginkgonis]|uniref:SpoIIE family protein phosphatase n=1 Tax=Hufsiella ginkgonis TaxID=2695274 RepID=A0A7K1XZC6_9SPHI|nr:response regulator [Hufsiella ginkgonis]MXV16302.1 SpoIIE family protein phosphatase [Hufsiella ginkgonis]
MTASKKILLVDDDRFMLELTARALEKEGFFCHKALSALEGLEILAQSLPDIILSDYDMPGLNGFDFRQRVLSDPKLKNIPFVFLTSFTDEDLMIKGLDLQAVDYITKNTPLAVIVSKLNNLLSTVREEHQRSLQELRKTAEALNLRSVPVKAPVIGGVKIDFLHHPFQNYPGGDFIDFIVVDNSFTFCILGDVMGKKWGAWFFSFNFLSYIRSAVRLCVFEGDLSTASILRKINKVIYLDPVLSDVFSTVSLIRIEHATGNILYSGAGDLPLIRYRADLDETSRLTSSGLLLGLFPDGKYDEAGVTMSKGDKLIMISDGMIDYEDEVGKKSDFQLFYNSVLPVIGQENAFERIKAATFAENTEKVQVDDCSMIFFEIK